MTEQILMERYISPETLMQWFTSMDSKDRIRFSRLLDKFHEEEEQAILSQRQELLEEMKKLVSEDGEQYFSAEYLKKYLGL